MPSRKFIIYLLLVLLINLLTVIPALANNLLINNVSIEDRNPGTHTATVQFDISWNNSWRSKINHDAVWVTVRLYNASQSPTYKKLCDLTSSGINPAGTTYGSNAGLEIAVPGDRKGAFIRPANFGENAAVAANDVQLTIDYSSCGFSATDTVHATVFGLEMVLVPEGAFYAGDFNGSSASLHEGSADSDPWYIAGEGSINVSNMATNGFRYASAGFPGEDATGAGFTVPMMYPKGYKAFYVMKYELNEGQWVEFLNSLPSAARANRDLTNSAHKNTDLVIKRNTLDCSGSPLICASNRGARAVSFLTWMDLAAFLDWAALRPMSELEFEKAARGPVLSTSGEFVWGNTHVAAADALSGAVESGTETVTTVGANANFGSTVLTGGDSANGAEYGQGPLRNGIFATADSTRESSGASYYGVMELSGDLREGLVTIGNATGRSFQGSHGDGKLSSVSGFEGNADQGDWPGMDAVAAHGVTGAAGSGSRGGAWDDAPANCTISDRSQAANAVAAAANNSGGRGVRTNDL